MDVPTISMPRHEAEEKLHHYRERAHRRADAEHETLVSAYEALAEGTPLISLQDAIGGAGKDEMMRPRLAIARADRRQIKFVWPSWSTRALFDAHHPNAKRRSESLVIEVEMGYRPDVEAPSGVLQTVRGYALVPLIPADVRNRMAGQPRDHFILWEVEDWSDVRIRAEPDRDPLLLRPLGGDLYAVLDSWDLTELERFVMRGRAEQ